MPEQLPKPQLARRLANPFSATRWLAGLTCACILSAEAAPLRIMPLGDSITAGYTDNPTWNVPFEFGYRSRLCTLLTNAGYDFVFVGGSLEPFNNAYGDPTQGGTVSPVLDLRPLGQNGHRGYGGVSINTTNSNVASYLTADTPDVILLMIGINGISINSPGQLDTLVGNIFTNRPTVKLITAQIIPKLPFTQLVVDYNTAIRNTLVPKYVGQGRAITTVDQYVNFLTNPAVNTSVNTALYSNAINHPTATGYNAMAETWFKGVLAIIPPTLPVLDQTRFNPAIAPATTIGNFAQPPSPSTETLAFTLVTGTGDTDNAKFSISGSQLRAGNYNFNNEPLGRTYSIRVRATGVSGGRIGERVFTLSLSDFDQLPDSWELAKAGNLTSLNDTGDFDHDGLTDTAEYNLSIGAYPNIDPTKRDTDSDGLSDLEEILGSSPRPPTNPTKADTDNDNFGDASEDNTGIYVSALKTGTNPTLTDTDGDKRSDGAELMEGSNPLSSSSPVANIIVSDKNSSELAYVAQVSSTDLLQGLSGANAVHSGWNTGNNASPTKLNDGLHGGTFIASPPTVEGAWAQASGSVSTFTLPAGNGCGWNLSSIVTFAAWNGAGFGNQKYEVGIHRVGEQAFSLLAAVNAQPFAVTEPGSSKVTITHPSGVLARGVNAIRFTMLSTNGNAGRTVYREFDVQGSPTIAPAPGMAGLSESRADRGEVGVTWFSYPGKSYKVETSVNLLNWNVLSPAYPSSGLTTHFIDSPVPLSRTKSFYRITSLP